MANPDSIHPTLAAMVGVELKGKVASLNPSMSYGFVELSDGSGLQFILKSSNYPGIKVGQPVRFSIDDGGAVDKMGKDLSTEQGLSP